MIGQESLLVSLVRLVDRIPFPPPPAKRTRGRPKTYSNRLFLKALVIMIIRKLRSLTNENLNEQFKGIFDAHGQVPTKGLVNTRRFALGAIVVYQLTLWYRSRRFATVQSRRDRARC